MLATGEVEDIEDTVINYMKHHAELYDLHVDGKLGNSIFSSDSFIVWTEEVSSQLRKILAPSDDEISCQNVNRSISAFFEDQIVRILNNTEYNDEKSYIQMDYDGETSNYLEFSRTKKGDVCSKTRRSKAVSAVPVYIDNPRILDGIDGIPSRINLESPEFIKALLSPSATPGQVFITPLFFKNYQKPDRSGQITLFEQENSDKILGEVEDSIIQIIGGRFVINSQGRMIFKRNDISRAIELCNLSSGVKSFAVLEWAISHGCLAENGTLILDEPEINLHPEWQIKYAQLIVKLQKILNLNIVVTTHSPYFMEAIEYSAKLEGLKDKYHCYLAEYSKGRSRISNVDMFPSYAYKKMVEPFALLDIMRNRAEGATNEE